MKNITHVIFDLGNVLINHDAEIFINEFIRLSGKDRQSVVDIFLDAYSDKFDTGIINGFEFYERIVSGLEIDMRYEEFHKVYCGIFHEKADFKPYVYKIMKKYKTALLSNIDELHHSFILKNWPWVADIKTAFVSYKLGVAKPDKRIYEKVLGQLGINGRNALFIDDREDNVKGAHDAGINSVQFTQTSHVISHLKKMKIL